MRPQEMRDDVHRHREDYGRVLLGRDRVQRLQVAELRQKTEMSIKSAGKSWLSAAYLKGRRTLRNDLGGLAKSS